MKLIAVLCLAIVGLALCGEGYNLFGDVDIPKNLHLAFTNRSDEIVISYHTQKPTPTRCWYHPKNTSYYSELYMDGKSLTYSGLKSGYSHNVIIRNLELDTVYSYRCGDGELISEWKEFKTRKENITSFTFGVYGDLGLFGTLWGNDTISSLNRVYSTNHWDFIWHLGDISYANNNAKFEHVWNAWFERMSPVMSAIPYMVTPGNHEKWSRDPILHRGSRNFTAFNQKFRMPGLESVGVDTNFFYSFDFGPVHIISLNSEYGFTGYPVDPEPLYEGKISGFNLNPQGYNMPHPVETMGNQTSFLQMNWLVEDLKKANANREKVPWILVGTHRPVYEPGFQKNGIPTKTCFKLQKWLEPLFKKYNVDIHFSGHVHRYSRQWPMYNNVATSKSYSWPEDTTYISHGAAGQIEGKDPVRGDTPDWYAFSNKDWSYGEVTIYNSTALRWRVYAAETDIILDEITLHRAR